jgi:hypothetical protein
VDLLKSTTPARMRSIAAQAIITALSLHNRGGCKKTNQKILDTKFLFFKMNLNLPGNAI